MTVLSVHRQLTNDKHDRLSENSERNSHRTRTSPQVPAAEVLLHTPHQQCRTYRIQTCNSQNENVGVTFRLNQWNPKKLTMNVVATWFQYACDIAGDCIRIEREYKESFQWKPLKLLTLTTFLLVSYYITKLNYAEQYYHCNQHIFGKVFLDSRQPTSVSGTCTHFDSSVITIWTLICTRLRAISPLAVISSIDLMHVIT